MLVKTKIAIISALEREVRPLIKNWRSVERQYEGGVFKFYEHDTSVLVCGGIGGQAARRATEAIINLYHPKQIQSVGFAGALNNTLQVGNVFTPSKVIDAKDGSQIEIPSGHGTLLTISEIAGVAQKSKFAAAYGADAIDMEAAAVARAAHAHGTPFMAVKSISDEHDFGLPPMDRFVDSEGQFRTTAFAFFIAMRPWYWAKAVKLAKNSSTAAKALCQWLQRHADSQKLDNSAAQPHLIEGEHSQASVG
jgi:adenosylhomocysteine nucleosidase